MLWNVMLFGLLLLNIKVATWKHFHEVFFIGEKYISIQPYLMYRVPDLKHLWLP